MSIAIITGASSGIGREYVRQLAKSAEKWEIDEFWVIARREKLLTDLQKEISIPLKCLSLDLADKSCRQVLAQELEEHKPDVKLLINAAGFAKIGRYDDIELDLTEKMIELNCVAAVALTQIVLSYMNAGARIMQICSVAAFQPLQFVNVYAASKSFLYNYSRALYAELRPRKISVTAVCPYWISDTEFLEIAGKPHNKKISYVKGFPFATHSEPVVRHSLKAAWRRKSVSTPDPFSGMQRIISKILPRCLLLAYWDVLRKL